jgi:hypothetical protein
MLHLICEHCGREIAVYSSRHRDVRKLLCDYSRGCFCQLDSETLEGLLNHDQHALRVHIQFRRAWYISLGETPEAADVYTAHYGFPIESRARCEMETILCFRQEQALFPQESGGVSM